MRTNADHRSRQRSTPLAHLRRTDPELREIVLRVRQWGLSQGVGASNDALTALLAVALEEARLGLSSPTEWGEGRVDEVVTLLAPGFCVELGVEPPDDLREAAALWLGYLDALGVLRQPERRRLKAVGWSRHPAGRRGA